MTLSLQTRCEISARYGSYALQFAKTIASEMPDVTFDQFYNALVQSNATGYYAKQAIRNAFDSIRKSA